jgi:hypothetical protein
MAAARRCAGPTPMAAAVSSEPRSRWQGWKASAAKPLSRRSWRTTLGGAEGEESLRPSVVHDGGVPHGSSDDPVVRALVLLRPQVKHCSLAANVSRTNSASTSSCLTKLETHVIMKNHMNVICLQYRNLPLCRRSGLDAPGTWCPAGSCRGPGQVAVAG